jgi:hypothetical protein
VGLSLVLSLLGVSLWVDQLFVTFMHESSHGIAAMLTGGRLVQFTIEPNASGLALTQGGIRLVVLTAGYAGACLWGGALLVASRRKGAEKAVLYALAAFMIGFTLLFTRNVFGFAVGLGMGAFFGWVGHRGENWQLSLLLSFLAVQSCMNAVKDLFTLLRAGTLPVMSDASLMSQALFGLMPPIACAVFIAFVSVALFALFMRVALHDELKRFGSRRSDRLSA